jgi:hypothetical protein
LAWLGSSLLCCVFILRCFALLCSVLLYIYIHLDPGVIESVVGPSRKYGTTRRGGSVNWVSTALRLGCGLYIGTPKISGMGRNQSELYSSVDIPPGFAVGEYGGTVKSRLDITKNDIHGWIIGLNQSFVLDARLVEPKIGSPSGSWANDPRGEFPYNCRLVITDTVLPGVSRSGFTTIERAWLVSVVWIYPGDALYVWYGRNYDAFDEVPYMV